MTIWDMAVNDVVLVVLALAGLSYLGLSLRHVLSFRQQTEVPDIAILPPVSVLKPLCGAEPRLYDCLRSFCEQDYPDFQIVFGVRESGDPAVAVVERLIAEFPHRDIALVCDARLHGANLKISNVMNILPSCRHDILVVSDSDVAVGPHCLRALVADAVADPLVGAVSCIYRGVPTQGWASVLGALNINAWIVPSVLLDKALNGVDACLGPVLLLRRKALDSVGGFQPVANYLAEDYEIGERLKQAGWKVRLSAFAIDTMVDETALGALFRHEVRWGHTVRAVRPADHILSGVTCVLPPQLALCLAHPTWWGGGLIVAYLALRLALTKAVERRFTLACRARWWQVPVREVLCFAVWAYSLFSRAVVWRGQPFKLLSGGRMVPLEAPDQPVSGDLIAANQSSHGTSSLRARDE